MSGLLTLAIESSNPAPPKGRARGGHDGARASVAVGVCHEDGSVDVRGLEEVRPEARLDDDLMPAISRLCERVSVAPRAIERVALSIGPGGYTSLRMSLSAAVMLADVAGALVVPVRSAEVGAWGTTESQTPAVVCMCAKRDQVFATLLIAPSEAASLESHLGDRLAPEAIDAARVRLCEASSPAWVRGSIDLGLITAEDVRLLRPKTLISDEHLPEPFRGVAEEMSIAIEPCKLDAERVLRLAAGQSGVQPDQVKPLYPREPEAVSLWRAKRAT